MTGLFPPNKTAVQRLPQVVLCESFDPRVLRAAETLVRHRIANITLLGNSMDLERAAVGARAELEKMEVIDYEQDAIQQQIRDVIENDADLAELDPTDPVVAGSWLVKVGKADAVIAGAATSASHTLRIYLRLLGTAPEYDTMSSMALLVLENCSFVRDHIIGLADVSVVPTPTVEQLADIAIQSAATYQRISGHDPHLAFLSFSSRGSSSDPAAKRVAEAAALTRKRRPELPVDGELQLDTALIPAVAGIKAPASSVAGNANVLIFPSLDAGNIAVKIFQKFSSHRVIGPVLQGLSVPASYIPRGYSADDIVDQVRLLII